MKLKSKLVILILFYLFLTSKIINAESKMKIFSSYQGQMVWENAIASCERLGMKLPTRKELKIAFKTAISKEWETDGLWYWSSDEFSKGNAYYMAVYNGGIFHAFKFNSGHVRCVHQ